MNKPLLALSLAIAAACGATAHAAYPERPVRVVVGFSPGGPTDVVARAFASYAGQALGQTFVVENKPGANTILAAEAVSKAAPDGYTLLVGATNHTMIPALYSNRVKFDALKSFTPLCAFAVSPTVLVTSPAMGVNSLDAFLAKVREAPGRITYATPGTGSSGHFATEQFQRLTQTQMNHIPYKGAAQAISDLMGGQVDSSFATLGSVLPQVTAGKLTALAVAAPQRLHQLPQVPTFAEAGVPGYSADAWYGVLAPAGLPQDVRATLEKVARDFAQAPATRASLDALGVQPRQTCGDAFTTQLSQEIDTYQKLANELGLKAD